VAVVASLSCFCDYTLASAQQDETDRSIDTSRAGTALTSHAPDTLGQFNASLIALTSRVSQAVVQIPLFYPTTSDSSHLLEGVFLGVSQAN
jgi:hypothetical protein